MKKIRWVNCIHIYQPPWQRPDVVRTVTSESYAFLVAMLKRFPSFKLTLNVAGSLLDHFESLGLDSIIHDLRALVTSGQIELTGSSYYHAFLPELPDSEITRQLVLQRDKLSRLFPNYEPRGCFLPELAYSTNVGRCVRALGYAWIILDPIHAPARVRANIHYRDSRTGLTVVFRNRKFSTSYPPEAIFNRIDDKRATTIITATDGELYGHFHKDWQEHLKRILESSAVETMTVSDYIDNLTVAEPIALRSASWQTKSHHLKRNNPFNLWYHTRNPIHHLLWRLAHTAIRLVAPRSRDANFWWARRHLDRGLASCSWWWASGVKTAAFAPVAWNPDEIERGAQELIKSIRSLRTLPARDRIAAEAIYALLMKTVWTKHWTTYGTQR